MKKKISTIIMTLFCMASIIAQENKVDIGLFGFVNRNLSFSFEHKLSDKFSVKSGLSYMLPGRLPYLDLSKKLIGDSDDTEGYLVIALDELRISAFSVTPEIRFFPGGKALKGFYIGPYAKYADYKFKSSYTSDVDYEEGGQSFSKENVVFYLTGHVRKLGGGLVMGYQWVISEKVSVDWCFFGPGLVYAFASSIVEAPEFPSSRDIGEFTSDELSLIPEILGTVDVEQMTKTSAKGTWNSFLPIYRFNISIGFAF